MCVFFTQKLHRNHNFYASFLTALMLFPNPYKSLGNDAASSCSIIYVRFIGEIVVINHSWSSAPAVVDNPNNFGPFCLLPRSSKCLPQCCHPQMGVPGGGQSKSILEHFASGFDHMLHHMQQDWTIYLEQFWAHYIIGFPT